MHKSPWQDEQFAENSLANMDKKFLPDTERQADWLLRKMRLRPSDTLLDLGCGAGRYAIAFAQRGLRVTGIDISATMLRHAKERAKAAGAKVHFIQADLADLERQQLGHFHGAICLCESGIGVLGGEGEDIAFLRQIHALLPPEGCFVLSCFNALRRYIRSKDQNPRFNYLCGTMDWSCELDGRELRELQRQYTPSEMKLLLHLSGFREIEVLSCVDGHFSNAPMGIEDIEMLVYANK